MRPYRERRSDFQLCLEIIELCQYPGGSITTLMNRSGLNYYKIKKILFGLVENELIQIEERDHSPSGDRRKTDYFIRTQDGHEVLKKANELTERLPIEGSP